MKTSLKHKFKPIDELTQSELIEEVKFMFTINE